jgi:hypothetical protein
VLVLEQQRDLDQAVVFMFFVPVASVSVFVTPMRTIVSVIHKTTSEGRKNRGSA